MKKIYKNIDKILLVSTILLAFFGLVMVFSASTVSTLLRYYQPTHYFFVKQAFYLFVVFLLGYFIILKVPLKNYKNLSYLATILVLISLIVVMVVGFSTGEHKRSIDLKVFNIQPSEFFKLTLILFSAYYYHSLIKLKSSKIYYYLIPGAVTFLGIVLVFLNKDLGTAFIIFLIGFLSFASLPNLTKQFKKYKSLILFVVIILLGFGLLFKDVFLSERQLNRLQFLNPCDRYQDVTGYQVCNGFIAINSGNLTGVGFGKSTQKYLYLPESHTDFIYPIVVEETGLIGGVLVLLMYGIILVRIYIISRNSTNLRNSLIAYGTFIVFFSHIILNLTGVLGLLPVTGVPLPFLSYGGSSTLVFGTLIFLVLRVQIENKEEKLRKSLKSL